MAPLEQCRTRWLLRVAEKVVRPIDLNSDAQAASVGDDQVEGVAMLCNVFMLQ